jgi:phosphatidylserine decarboxylase
MSDYRLIGMDNAHMTLNEIRQFSRTFRGDVAGVGSLIPTSPYAARAMASELARDTRPRNILEVGVGTGSVTAEIVKSIGPDDRLTLVELNSEFAAYLRDRVETDPEFARVRDQIDVREMNVLDLEAGVTFDYIVSAIPFSNLPPELVSAILLRYQTLLKPGGVLSFIEYIYGRTLKQIGAQAINDEATLNKAAAVENIIASQARAYEFRRDTVLRNVPPAWVRHWRFDAAKAESAVHLLPREHTQRVAIGSVAFDTDALPFLAGLGALAWATRKRAPVLSGIATLAAAGAAIFLRDPKRSVPIDGDLAVSACDGEVMRIEQVHDLRFGEGTWTRIACFLSITDTHINRAPVAGKVVDVIFEDGGYAPAMQDEAEHNCAAYTVIDSADGGRVIVAQRVGAVARRIVNRCKAGDVLARGEKIGLIRFGSRTDVYLPVDHYEVLVQPGDRMRAGETVIAKRVG